MTTYYRSAIALADAISSGETSAVESLALCIQRVEQFDGVLNAVCNRVDEPGETTGADAGPGYRPRRTSRPPAWRADDGQRGI